MRTCSICNHTNQETIDKMLGDYVPLRQIVEQCGTSLGALSRHKHHKGAATQVDAESMREHLAALRKEIERRRKEAGARRAKSNWNMENAIKAELVTLLNYIEEELDGYVIRGT